MARGSKIGPLAVFFAVFNSLTENGSPNSWHGSLKKVVASFFKRSNQSMNPSVPFAPKEKKPLTLCPVALVIGCEKCPLFKPCPFKTILGDQKKGK